MINTNKNPDKYSVVVVDDDDDDDVDVVVDFSQICFLNKFLFFLFYFFVRACLKLSLTHEQNKKVVPVATKNRIQLRNYQSNGKQCLR